MNELELLKASERLVMWSKITFVFALGVLLIAMSVLIYVLVIR